MLKSTFLIQESLRECRTCRPKGTSAQHTSAPGHLGQDGLAQDLRHLGSCKRHLGSSKFDIKLK